MNYTVYFKVFSYIPFMSLFCLLLLILHAYILYGHMPVYSNPDPKTLSITYTIYIIVDFLLIFSFLIYPILSIIVIYKKLQTIMLIKYILIYLLGLILLLIAYRVKEFNLGIWIAD